MLFASTGFPLSSRDWRIKSARDVSKKNILMSTKFLEIIRPCGVGIRSTNSVVKSPRTSFLRRIIRGREIGQNPWILSGQVVGIVWITPQGPYITTAGVGMRLPALPRATRKILVETKLFGPSGTPNAELWITFSQKRQKVQKDGSL